MSVYENYALIGLGVAVCALIGWIVMLQVRLSRLNKQYTQLMTGTDGASLEEALSRHIDEIREAVETALDLKTRTRVVEQTLEHSMQWMGMIRFNPFRNTGGAQSFALAILDGQGNGVVISSLHARENTRVYAKPLIKWESEYTLTDEEKEAIARAHQQRA